MGTKWKTICDRNEYFLTHGWSVGDVNPDNKPLNKKSYDDEGNGVVGKLAIAKDLTSDICNGKIVPWEGLVRGIMPLFVSPNEVDPVSNEILLWRVIRDGSCGTDAFPSVNSLTPDSAAAMTLPNILKLAHFMYIMYLQYGPGFLMAKTDLAGAFRQYPWAIYEAEKLIYRFDNVLLGDTCNIWGCRTGSRLTQDWTQMLCRIFLLLQNGIEQLDDINRAVEMVDFRHFMRRFQGDIGSVDDFKQHDVCPIPNEEHRTASVQKEEDRVLQPLHLQGAEAGPSGDWNVEAGNDCDERLRPRYL